MITRLFYPGINGMDILSPRKLVLILITVLFIQSSCTVEGPEKNSSTLGTIPMNSLLSFVSSYSIDEQGEFMYMTYVDLGVGRGVVMKLRLSDLSLVNSVYVPQGWQTWGGNNLVILRNNKFVVAAKDVVNGIDYCMLYNSDLSMERLDTIGFNSFDLKILRLFKDNDHNLAAIYNSQDTLGQVFVEYIEYEQDLSRKRVIQDTIVTNPEFTGGANAIKCEDGSILYAMSTFLPPTYQENLRLEKRDEDFKLLWSTPFSTELGAFFYNVVELNGKFYVYGHGASMDKPSEKSFIILVYDQSGNLLKRKDISSGQLNDKRSEPIVPTQDGGFLITGLTSNLTDVTSRKAILFKLDANLNVVRSKILGGADDVASSGLIKVTPGKYLLMYSENSFDSDQQYRLVLRYVDEDGNFLE